MATISTVNDGWTALAEASIKLAIREMETDYPVQHKYTACRFLTNEKQKDIFIGLAPHMIRDWEAAEVKARRILTTELSNYDPRKERK